MVKGIFRPTTAMRARVFVLALMASSLLGAAPSLADEPPLALHVGREWLEALREGNVDALRTVTGSPFSIAGFDLDSGDAKVGCGGKSRSDGIVGVREFHPTKPLSLDAENDADLNALLGCLVKDSMLRDYIPQDPGWASGTAEHVSGTLRAVGPKQVSRRLARYRRAMGKASRDSVLVQAVMTDHNGVTNTVLLAVSKAQPAKVTSVWVDELFEE